jgi:hypothetical protein
MEPRHSTCVVDGPEVGACDTLRCCTALSCPWILPAVAAFGQGSGFHTSPMVPDGMLPAVLQLEGEFGPQPIELTVTRHEEQGAAEEARADAEEHSRHRGGSRRVPSRRAAAAAVAAIRASSLEEGELQVGGRVGGSSTDPGAPWLATCIVCIGTCLAGAEPRLPNQAAGTGRAAAPGHVRRVRSCLLQAHTAGLPPLPRRQPSLPISDGVGGVGRTGRPLQTAVQRFNGNRRRHRHSGSGDGHGLHSDDSDGAAC